MAAHLLEIQGLTKAFIGVRAVDNVSFHVDEDEMVGLIGPNGAGKTTLMHLICGILKPTSGSVIFKGEDITGKKVWDIVTKGISATFQVVRPFRKLPVFANVMVPCLSERSRRRKGEWVKSLEQRTQDSLEFCGIGDRALEFASTLSHGDLKRLELARAIANEPELLLLDEPFGGLNAPETSLISKSLKRLHAGGRFGRLHREGPSMLIVEHKLSDLMKILDRVVVLNFGHLLAEGSPKEIMNNEEVIKAYIGKKGVS